MIDPKEDLKRQEEQALLDEMHRQEYEEYMHWMEEGCPPMNPDYADMLRRRWPLSNVHNEERD